MRPDKYRKRSQAPRADDRARRQIAAEAARRLLATIEPGADPSSLAEAGEAAFYTAKRRAAAVLGHRVRPGDLPTDLEVREQIRALAAAPPSTAPAGDEADDDDREPADPPRLAEWIDRFELYRMRLGPLEGFKLDARSHPEGDALYHALQVFELARADRPFDEDFLLAALLHEVGRPIAVATGVRDPGPATLELLRGAIDERTAWLIEHHRALRPGRDGSPPAPDARARKAMGAAPADWVEDLRLLGRLDRDGRESGAPVVTVVEALDYLRELAAEADDQPGRDGPPDRPEGGPRG